MRKSKEETAQTRKRIVEGAAAEFRRNGINETGLSDLMAAVGLTHGGFYRHFDSKEQLVAEACDMACDLAAHDVSSARSRKGKRPALEQIITDYLSPDHRDDPAEGCLFAALGSELARADKKTRAAATDGLLKLANALAAEFPDVKPEVAKRQALAALSTMVGAVILSRIVTDRRLSNAILREAAKRVAGA